MKHFHWNIRVKNWSSLQFSLVNVNKHLRYIFSTVCRRNERKLCVVVVYVRHLSSTTYMYCSSGGVQAFPRHIVLRELGGGIVGVGPRQKAWPARESSLQASGSFNCSTPTHRVFHVT